MKRIYGYETERETYAKLKDICARLFAAGDKPIDGDEMRDIANRLDVLLHDSFYPLHDEEAPETKGDRVKRLGLEEFTFDYALPQDWVDDCAAYLCRTYPNKYGRTDEADKTGTISAYDVLVGGLVWLYDKHGGLYGRPYPITDEATQALKALPRNKSRMLHSTIEEPEKKE